MNITKNQIKKIESAVQKIYNKNNDPFHHYNHALRTAKLAVIIAKKEKADEKVCYVAGLVHDIYPKKRGKPHSEKSAKKSEKLLKKLGIDADFIKKVVAAVQYHDTRVSHKNKTLEGKIIFDADKIQCYGPVGIIRDYGDLLIKNYKPEEAIIKLFDHLENFNPKFFTKSGQRIRNKLREYDLNFVKLFKKYN